MSRMPTSGARKASMPRETTCSASMSRPESVSSSTANLGPNMCICSISSRFFSPPENPSFTDRVMKESSTSRSFSFSASILRNCGIWMSVFFRSPAAAVVPRSARRALIAVRRKLATETPGIAAGYWNARKSPARARSSTGILRTSCPLNRIVPDVTLYRGWPMIVSASVLLPEPFGPMIAWTSPLFTARSIPFRIGFASTSTWRSLISRSGKRALLRGLDRCRGSRGLHEIREGHAVERLRDALLHRHPHVMGRTARLQDAVHDRLALDGADLRLDRSLQRANDVAGGDRGRRARERVAAARSALAMDEARLAQACDELFEIRLGQLLARRDGVQAHRARAVMPCK